MSFEVSYDKIVDLINRNELITMRYLPGNDPHNDDDCGFDMGEYGLPYTFAAGDLIEREVRVRFVLTIVFEDGGRTEVQDVAFSYETDLSKEESQGLTSLVFERFEEWKTRVIV